MTRLAIQMADDRTDESCAVCGVRLRCVSGPQLFVAGSDRVVCRSCGLKLQPALVALVDLAGAAERVGSIARHTLWMPLERMLDLAHAAQQYTDSVTEREPA